MRRSRSAFSSSCSSFASLPSSSAAALRPLVALAALFLPLLAPGAAEADEGMWPFNMVPVDQIQKDHGVTLTPAWLDHVRLASVRLNNGGSGSFVSPHGLILTNHHVAGDCIAKIATAAHDYLKTGYLAGTDGPEVPCPDLEVDQLVKIDDVTDAVKGARQPAMTDAQANVAMKSAMTKLEQDCKNAAGASSRCDVVTLYGGGKYNLYTYRKYTDIRLVMAPEADIAFFGGDPDNFTYPRYDYDMALFRAYDGGQPVTPTDYLKWEAAGPKEGDVTFTSGNPGSTNRQRTVAQLATYRDALYPSILGQLAHLREGLQAFATWYGPEGAREIREAVFTIQNSEKALSGMLRGLKNPALMQRKAATEAALRAAVAKDPTLSAEYGSTWDDIAAVQKTYAAIYPRFAVLEGGLSTSRLFGIARALVRMPAELAKPNDARLREYRDSALDSLKQGLLSDAPVYGGIEAVSLRVWLERLQTAAPDVATAVLRGKSPQEVAQAAVAGSRLSEVAVRKALLDGGQAAVDASTDGVIALLRAVDAEARKVRKHYEDGVEAPLRNDSRKIADATFAVNGAGTYPDATFTLRLSVGVVKGYRDGGRDIPWSTDFAGMYGHATGKAPLALPQRWLDARSALTASTPLDFVSTNDTTGGNSGSPLVNAAGNLVGLLFDGNIPGLPNTFVYDDTAGRAVSVDTAGILEGLTKVYGATAIVKELLGT